MTPSPPDAHSSHQHNNGHDNPPPSSQEETEEIENNNNNNNNTENTPNLNRGDDSMVAEMGYTPLDDFQFEGEEGASYYFSVPPDHNDSRDYGELNVGSDFDDEQESGFQSIADGALRSLEEEYASTIRDGIGSENANELNPNEENTFEPFNDEETVENEATSTPSRHQDSSSVRRQHDNEKTPSSPQREIPIDTEAVRRAMNSIRLRSPQLTAALDSFCRDGKPSAIVPSSLSALEQPPPSGSCHPIIPSAPLAAFHRSSSKALQATSNLTRSATLADAFRRLSLFPFRKSELVIHIVGADRVECSSEQSLRSALGPLVRWMSASSSFNSLKEIEIILMGPNVPLAAVRRPPVDLLPDAGRTLKRATAVCLDCLYHDYDCRNRRPPDVVVAFNAGIWGYDDWRPTLESLSKSRRPIPFVVTAYTVEEAEDDAIAIRGVVGDSGGKQCWGVEVNPFRSRVKRETVTAVDDGRVYYENGAWQAWMMGGEGLP